MRYLFFKSDHNFATVTRGVPLTLSLRVFGIGDDKKKKFSSYHKTIRYKHTILLNQTEIY